MSRRISRLLALAAYAAPLWAFQELAAASEEHAHHYVCGQQALAILIVAALGSALLSLGSIVFGTSAYRALPKPRPRRRLLELLLVSLPMSAAGSFFLFL